MRPAQQEAGQGKRWEEEANSGQSTQDLVVLLRSLDFILRTTVYFKYGVTRFHLCFGKSILAEVSSVASRGLWCREISWQAVESTLS